MRLPQLVSRKAGVDLEYTEATSRIDSSWLVLRICARAPILWLCGCGCCVNEFTSLDMTKSFF